MPVNPLDWTAAPFLELLAAVAAAALAFAIFLRSRVYHTLPSSPPARPEILEAAWLTLGRERAADTVLVALFEAGAAVPGDGRGGIQLHPHGASIPWYAEPFVRMAAGATNRRRFHAAIRRGLDTIRDNLAREGLIPTPGQMARLRAATALIMAVPLVLGGMKAAVGTSRGHPVGYLMTMEMLIVFAAFVLILRPMRRTAAGARALRNLRETVARAARAPVDGERVLAFALGGAVVLAGTPYASVLPLVRNGSDGGCTSSCGGDGGGGGGGGGCGGCGG